MQRERETTHRLLPNLAVRTLAPAGLASKVLGNTQLTQIAAILRPCYCYNKIKYSLLPF